MIQLLVFFLLKQVLELFFVFVLLNYTNFLFTTIRLTYTPYRRVLVHLNLCFKMLLNENSIIYRGNDSIALIGVENWGKPPFKQYGNLERAMRGVENIPFKILLSHDPSHFDVIVKDPIDSRMIQFGYLEVISKKIKHFF